MDATWGKVLPPLSQDMINRSKLSLVERIRLAANPKVRDDMAVAFVIEVGKRDIRYEFLDDTDIATLTHTLNNKKPYRGRAMDMRNIAKKLEALGV